MSFCIISCVFYCVRFICIVHAAFVRIKLMTMIKTELDMRFIVQ